MYFPGFSYFLTTQMRQTSPSAYHSKLVRVCHDDSDYYSYTEIPIQCTSGSTYTELIIKSFLAKDSAVYRLILVTIPYRQHPDKS